MTTVPHDKLCLMADEELLEMVAEMNADAFEIIYDRHIKASYSLAYRIAGNNAAADDICQETFLSVWRSGGRYNRQIGSVRSWLLSITHNRAIDYLRKVTRYQEHNVYDEEAAEMIEAADDTQVSAFQAITTEDTKRLLDKLPSDQRQVVELAFYSGYSHRQIANQLDLPLGTVKGRVRLALNKLRSELQGASYGTV